MSFYKTQIQRVGSGTAIDIQGKTLRFMGNLPCQAGSTVWTDGKFIFGNVSVKSQPVIDGGNILGIPVAFEDSLGYISSIGKLRAYKIADDLWIVNDDKIYKHGDDENIIDAEISSDKKLLTATGGFYRKSKSLDLRNHLYSKVITRYYDDNPPEIKKYAVAKKIESFVGTTFILGIDKKYDSEGTIKIYKDGKVINSVDLKQFADLVETDALKIQDKIMSKSNINLDDVNLIRQSPPPKNFIASTYAKIATFHFSKNGDWDAVIIASTYGYCFPYRTFDASVFVASFPNGEDKVFSEYLVWCIDTFEEVVFEKQSLPFRPDFEKYKDFEGEEKENGEYTQDYKDYILAKAAYYIPLARFKYYHWFTMVYSAVKILRVHNGEVSETIYENSGGGTAIEDMLVEWNGKKMLQYFSWDETQLNIQEYTDFVFPAADEESYEKKSQWTFPLDENYYFKADGLKILAIYKKSDDSKVVDVPEDVISELYNQNYYEDYFIYPTEPMYQIDEVSEWYANEYDLAELDEGTYLLRPRFHYKRITPDTDEPTIIYDSTPKNDKYKTLSGWFLTSDDEDDLCIRYCFAKVRNQFFLGIRKGGLMKFNSENIEKIGDGLKNFRLRELKNISNARK